MTCGLSALEPIEQRAHERVPQAPLPDGYTLGELLYFTGVSQTASSGDKVAHGQQGEVVGPATGENTKGKGLTMRFPGNKGIIDCQLTNLSRAVRASLAA